MRVPIPCPLVSYPPFLYPLHRLHGLPTGPFPLYVVCSSFSCTALPCPCLVPHWLQEALHHPLLSSGYSEVTSAVPHSISFKQAIPLYFNPLLNFINFSTFIQLSENENWSLESYNNRGKQQIKPKKSDWLQQLASSLSFRKMNLELHLNLNDGNLSVLCYLLSMISDHFESWAHLELLY